jgi:hypothetical protein
VIALVVPFLLSMGFVVVPLVPGAATAGGLPTRGLRLATWLVIVMAASAAMILVVEACPPSAAVEPFALSVRHRGLLIGLLLVLTLVAGAVDAFAPESSSLAMWVGPVAGFVTVMPLLVRGAEATEPMGAGLIGLGLGFGLGAIARAAAAVSLRRWTGRTERPLAGL